MSDTSEYVQPPAPTPHPPEVVEWLRKNAIPIATAQPGGGVDDLRPLGDLFAGARVVSLGEATHGTREFFQLKHRILEFCVTELGFDAFVIEAAFAESLPIDEYVRMGVGGAGAGVASMRFWTWDTEEVVRLVEWMREHNLSGGRPIRYFGYDMQTPAVSARALIEYLEEREPALAADAARDLAPLTSDFGATQWGSIPEKVRTAAAETLERVSASLQNKLSSNPDETDRLAAIHANVVTKVSGGLANPQSMFSVRDETMAENTVALMDLLGPDSKVVGWAHNGHAQRSPFYGGIGSMGHHLDAVFGDAQRVVGFAFGEGTAQAVRFPKDGLRYHTVGPIPEGSMEAACAEVGLPLFAIDLRTAPDGAVSDWLSSQPLHRSFGAFYDEEIADQFFARMDPRSAYDVLIFVAKGTAARRNPSGIRPTPPLAAPTVLEAPTNLDFAERESMDRPASWTPPAPAGPSPYVLAVRPGEAPGGGNVLEIARPWAVVSWGSCTVTQAF